MKAVWQASDGELFDDSDDARAHEDKLDTRETIRAWVDGRSWSDADKANWLKTVLSNNYEPLRTFLNTLP